jgi:hypothetical protein
LPPAEEEEYVPLFMTEAEEDEDDVMPECPEVLPVSSCCLCCFVVDNDNKSAALLREHTHCPTYNDPGHMKKKF